jgi:hypothetical protein
VSAANGQPPDPDLEELRQQKALFDNTWTLVTALALGSVVLCWYFRLAQIDIAPLIWSLFGLALAQWLLSAYDPLKDSQAGLRWMGLASQLLGTTLMGFAWHLFGGLQQPIFPLFIVLPLLPGALLLGFWQQQMAIAALLVVLLSGMLLSPNGNSFLEQRDGLGIVSTLLPSWVPRSRAVFPDVNTSPMFDLIMVIATAVIGVALSASARTLASLYRRGADRLRTLSVDLARQQRLGSELLARSPCAAVLVSCGNGRILGASDVFAREFAVPDPIGRFLLDAVSFSYPTVIRRLLQTGGEHIQQAQLGGRDLILRVRVEQLSYTESPTSLLILEQLDGLCWRAEVDALDEPALAISDRGCVLAANRAARALFGGSHDGAPADDLFGAGDGRWWSIAPLESARRLLERDGRRYLVSIRRERIADSIGEMSFIRVYEYTAPAKVA